jgi:nucleoside-diphosphate-sugar epimerase
MLVQAGHEVVGVDTDLYRRRSTFVSWQELVRTIVKDIREVWAAEVRGFDAVVHLAALSKDPLGDLNPQLTYDIDHRASVRLTVRAREAGVSQFVFASSCSNYGAAGDAPVNEEGRRYLRIDQPKTLIASHHTAAGPLLGPAAPCLRSS